MKNTGLSQKFRLVFFCFDLFWKSGRQLNLKPKNERSEILLLAVKSGLINTTPSGCTNLYWLWKHIIFAEEDGIQLLIFRQCSGYWLDWYQHCRSARYRLQMCLDYQMPGDCSQIQQRCSIKRRANTTPRLFQGFVIGIFCLTRSCSVRCQYSQCLSCSSHWMLLEFHCYMFSVL